MPAVPNAVHVATAALNQTVGDWSGNRARIVEACQQARDRGAQMIALTEKSISSYSLGDRVWMRGTVERSLRSLEDTLPATRGLVTFLGLPVALQGTLYDAIAVVVDGRVVGVVPKENLATSDLEYENRWFAGWSRGRVETIDMPGGPVPFGSLVFEAAGLGRFAVEVCEDGWKGIRPGAIAALAGAHVLVNTSASWFVLGKQRVRRDLVAGISREDHVAYVYASLAGCDATRLIFDGATLIGVGGKVVAEGPRFCSDRDVVMVDHVVDLAGLELRRRSSGSWRQQVEAFEAGAYGAAPHLVTLPDVFPDTAPPPAPPAYWEVPPPAPVAPSLDWVVEAGLLDGPLREADVPHLELELALATGLREYLRKSGIPGVALALSGGRDSAMCAVLVQRMLRYLHPGASDDALRALVRSHLVTTWLATDNSSDATEAAARALADEIGAEHLACNLQQAVDLHRTLVGGMTGEDLSWATPGHDLALQNVQARLRGSLVWFVANLKGRLLLTTSNKSEVAVGYCTMDGDTAGGLAPIADVPKSLVAAWLAWARARHGLASLDHVLHTPATAELRPPEAHQTDEADLMPYAVLDRLIYHFAWLGEEPAVLFRRLWPELRERYDGDVRAFGAHVHRFVRLFCQGQWKRERYAISFRVTAFDLDPKHGFRFPPIQAPFTEELADLQAAIDELAAGG